MASLRKYFKLMEEHPQLFTGEPKKPKGEAIQNFEILGLDELEKWIFNGQITDWFTIMAFLMFEKKYKEGK